MFKKVIFLLCSTMAFNVHAHVTYTVHCPEIIETSQDAIAQYSDWRILTEKPSSHVLSRVTIYSGAPEEMASLAPEFSNKNSKAKWQFLEKDKIYIVCGYHKTNLRLAQKLPAHTTSCTVTYDLRVQGNAEWIPEKIICEKKDLTSD